MDANGDSLATPAVHTLTAYTVNNQAAGSYTHTFNTETFCGDVTITIQAGDQTITIHNPKKRHKLLIPKGSFTYTTSAGYGGYNWGEPCIDQPAATWGYYEWPDFVVVDIKNNNKEVNNGSRKIYQSGPNKGTTDHEVEGAYTDATLDIDAHYGGRDMDFFENSPFLFHTYYNYDQSGNPTTPQVFRTTVGAICNAYNGTIIDMVIAFEVPEGGGAKPSWAAPWFAPRKK